MDNEAGLFLGNTKAASWRGRPRPPLRGPRVRARRRPHRAAALRASAWQTPSRDHGRLPLPGRAGGPILPRSLHLPLAVTEGSLIENVNKTGVRLWTDSSRPVPETNRGRRPRTLIAGDSPVIARLLLSSCPAPPSDGSATPKRHPPSFAPPPRRARRREPNQKTQ